MSLQLPDLCLVVMVGVSGSGKSSFAARHFLPTEVISSDACRGLVSDDESSQEATSDAFDLVTYIAAKRLARGHLTVIDATNVQAEARRPLVALAKEHHVLAVAVVLDLPERECAARNAGRPDRQFGPHVLRRQHDQLRRSVKGLRREGFHRVYVLSGATEIDEAVFRREPVWNDRRDDHGPLDIIGDVHGCHVELVELLTALGYEIASSATTAAHPDGRRALFLGDLIDRGPATPAVLRLVMGMVADGAALCLPGNHEVKLRRALEGRAVTTSHGLAQTLDQLAAEPPEFSARVSKWIDGLIGHYVLDDGKLVVAHAGLPKSMHGRSSAAVRAFALYGDTTGETDEYGLPVRYPWADDYRGQAMVVYGHTPVPDPVWVNNTICIDTGCVFGGRLTALRYPERELVSVAAHAVYYEPARPLHPPAGAGEDGQDQVREDGHARGQDDRAGLAPDELDVNDVTGKRIVRTRLSHPVTIREDNAAAALEVMSRFAVDPRWLVYLPPTMAPPATSARPGLLEHPEQAFEAYRAAGVARVVCEEKHMGSRAVVIAGRDRATAAARFGIDSDEAGTIFTRTGRSFFSDRRRQTAFLDRIRTGIERAGLWDELETDWLALDCELLPWSAKAEPLIRRQYGPVGAAGTRSLAEEAAVIAATQARGIDVGDLGPAATARAEMMAGFVAAYRRYCWPVGDPGDLKLAPFQVLAGEGAVHALKDHLWHLEVIDRLCATDAATFRPTRSITASLDDAGSLDAATAWWQGLTEAGGEGMVVKPLDVIYAGDSAPGPPRLPQPGIKCRGREYLRIVYGPEYTTEGYLSRLRARSLGHKRSMAQRQFALGIEALERFVSGAPLHQVHECVFGVLALESEPVDPRL